MEKAEFPEREFETLVNHELLNRLKCDIYIPSQQKEKRSGLDALFQGRRRKLLAIQYKKADEYIEKPSGLKQPAFRFDLHYYLDANQNKIFRQHNLLVEKVKRNMLAGYVVPGFVTYSDLFNYYHNRTLLNNSYIINPGHRIYDNKSHYINYDSNVAFLHSEEGIKTEIYQLSDMKTIIEDSESFYKEEFINLLKETFCEIYGKSCELDEKEIDCFLAKNRITLFAL